MKRLKYFTKTEILLWSISVSIILLSFILFDRKNHLTLIASLIGVTSLIFNAKGNPFGQILMILFSLLYGFISFKFGYYGEMITYVVTMPMAVFSLISWLKNPYKGNISEVSVNKVNKREWCFACILTAILTAIFYFILEAFNTFQLILSTISIATSFLAVYLTFMRSLYFATVYALNDIVLICLWIIASINNIGYISVVVCFVVFLINDIYGFICWQKMKKRQVN